MKKSMSRAIERALEADRIHYWKEGDGFLFLNTTEKEADYLIKILPDEEMEVLFVIGFFPVKAPKLSMDRMYKVINDINHRRYICELVMNPEDGQITYRSVNHVDQGAINKEIVHMAAAHVVEHLILCYDELMQAMYSSSNTSYAISFDDEKRPCA